MQLSLSNQVAIITGGTSGIGKAIAKCFLNAGGIVYLIGSRPEKGQKALEELQNDAASSSHLFFKACDVSSTDQVKNCFTEILSQQNRIDILVNCAGVTRDALLMKMTEQMWDEVIAINLKSVFNTCQFLTRPMMKQRQGRIINISSVVGLQGNIGQANYAASKAGIFGFTKSLAKEVASRGVTCNCVAPGFIQTPMTQDFTEKMIDDINQDIPLKRMGLPEEIAALVLFLASEKGSYITGQVLQVDGGISM